MAIDAYSPCPGGTGKKIKFCCGDLLSDLQKIDRMLEGEQFQGCLNHVEALLKKTPDRACLLATRSMLLRGTNQPEAAQQAARDFLEKHPDNPIALADAASLAAEQEDGRIAMELLQRALNASGESLEARVYAAMGDVAEALAAEGEIMAALPLLHAQAQLQHEDPRPRELAAEIQQSPKIPVLLKDQRWLPDAPDGVPWKSKYDSAANAARLLQWSVCEQRLSTLVAEVGEEPIVWRSLATVRGWLADRDGAIEALRKYASLDVPPDDAVEAEALARLLSDDPLGDLVDVLTVTYAVNDVSQLQTALTLSRQIDTDRVDPAALAQENEPPPRAVYHILDRAVAETTGEPRLQDLPNDLCLGLLFGRQTDREARLELMMVSTDELDQIKSIVASAAGQYLGDEISREQVGRNSRTRRMGTPRLRIPPDANRAAAQEIIRQHFDDAMLQQWPRLPLGYLDGKSPEEAARLDDYRIRVSAAVMVVESWFESQEERFDFDRLRERLGLPIPQPIDPEQKDLESVPLIRWSRIQVDKLPDDRLLKVFPFAVAYHAVQAIEHLGRAILERPSLEGRQERLRVYGVLAFAHGATDRGLEYIDRGRKEAEAAGQSSASWDLQELQFRFARLEGEEASRLMSHIDSRHGREPGVREALVRFLMQIGVIGPDGQPRAMPRTAAARDAAPEPEPGKLWTPESQQPAGEQRKLWVPGMD
ncbi:MAG: hypothetical protein GXY83_05790 [Rhodopirellula sp.]|nr:hypothetical protein [Rhodopirellula sp.]